MLRRELSISGMCISGMCIHDNTLTVEEWRHLPTVFWHRAWAALVEERGGPAEAVSSQ